MSLTRARAAVPLWLQFAVLWFAGMDLRLTLLAVPPVIPILHRELHLNETAVGALSGIPVLILGLAAIPGSLVIARLGAKRALLIGIVLVAVASGLRGAGNNVVVLFVMTVIMGVGIAGMQPAFPALVHEAYPSRIAVATSVWANGLLVGEALAASLTLPFVLPLVGGRWQWAFALWSVPVALTALAVALLVPSSHTHAGRPRAWLPNWRDQRLWEVGVLQSTASLIYFGANTFVPDYLHATHQAPLVAPALAALNIGQLPASLAIGLLPWRVIARRENCFVVAAAIAVALWGLLVVGGWATIAATGCFGFCGAFILVLSFAMPAMLAEGPDVARMSAGIFTISYLIAFVATLAAGAAWDRTHVLATAFLPLGLALAIIAAVGPRVMGRATRTTHEPR